MSLTAVVFCAGYGTRLKPLTDHQPKPLLNLPGGCCLERIIKALTHNGVKKILLNVHHLKEHILTFSKKYSNVHVLEEDHILETGGGLLNMLHLIDDEILLINGDIWIQNMQQTLIDITYYFTSLKLPNLLLQIPVAEALFYDKKGDFFQKKSHSLIHNIFKINRNLPSFEKTAPFVFGGIHLWRRKFIVENKPFETNFSMRHYFDIAENHHNLYGFSINQKWCDIGSLSAYKGLFHYLEMDN